MRYTGNVFGGQVAHVGRIVVFCAPNERRLRSATIEHISANGTPEIVGRSGSDGRKPMAFTGEQVDRHVPHLNFVKCEKAEDIEALPPGSWTWPIPV